MFNWFLCLSFLKQEMQKCFDEKDIQMLQDTISKMDPTVVNSHFYIFIHSVAVTQLE